MPWTKAAEVPGLFGQADINTIESRQVPSCLPVTHPTHDAHTRQAESDHRAETTYYSRNGVTITTTRAMFREKVYPINGMTSVRPVRIEPDQTAPILLLILCLFVIACSGHFAIAENKNLIVLALFAVAGGVICILWLRNLRPKHAVFICTAAREQQAYVTQDRDEVYRIVEALNRAFVDRG
jgi:hypothetical protein